MRLLLIFFLCGSVFGGEDKSLQLEYKEGISADYAVQIQAGFKKLLDSDPDLAKDFKRFESPPPEDARGKYSSEAIIQALTLSESEHADFRLAGGKRQFAKTIALYYRFDEGMHKGRESRSGFFAIFVVKGALSYRHAEGEKFELKGSKIVAVFKGFTRDIASLQPQ